MLTISIAGVVAVAAAIWLGRGRSSSSGAGQTCITLRAGLEPEDRMTAHVPTRNLAKAVRMYAELTGLEPWPDKRKLVERVDSWCDGRLLRFGLYKPAPRLDAGISLHRDGLRMAVEVKEELENVFARAGLKPERKGRRYFELLPVRQSHG